MFEIHLAGETPASAEPTRIAASLRGLVLLVSAHAFLYVEQNTLA